MPFESSAVSAPHVSMPAVTAPQSAAETFNERWAAWQARGAAHDRAVRRKLATGVPIVAAVAALLYLVLAR